MNFLKKKVSILAARLSGLGGNGLRDFHARVYPKISLKPIESHGRFSAVPGTLSMRETERFSTSVENVVESDAG